MSKSHISDAIQIWHDQFIKYCGQDSFPDFWIGGKQTLELYLLQQIENGNAIVAEKNGTIIGYMAWMYFDFHNERTAFCPIVGHAVIADDKENIYQNLYTIASQTWVNDGRFNHLWMTFYDDVLLRDMLYDIGFGSYVMDACQKVSQNTLTTNCAYRVTKAISDDADLLLKLANETPRYYSDAPIFLKRSDYTRNDILKIIDDDAVFLAWDNDNLIGAMEVNTKQNYHFERLTSETESAYIEDVGVYIKSEYRGKGVGTLLLYEVFRYCDEADKPFLHVSFETSNPYANKFWLKYFRPIIRSVRRTVNKDANFH